MFGQSWMMERSPDEVVSELIGRVNEKRLEAQQAKHYNFYLAEEINDIAVKIKKDVTR